PTHPHVRTVACSWFGQGRATSAITAGTRAVAVRNLAYAFSTSSTNPSVSLILTRVPFCINPSDVLAENSSLVTTTVPLDSVMSDVARPVDPINRLRVSSVKFDGGLS